MLRSFTRVFRQEFGLCYILMPPCSRPVELITATSEVLARRSFLLPPPTTYIPHGTFATNLRPPERSEPDDLALNHAEEQGFEEEDKLYRMIELEVKGHEDAVLNSYQKFLCEAAKGLDITVSRVYTPLRHYDRSLSLLKSNFVYKKHMVQYEIRTYFRVIQLKNLTGSTADTYLEYVERNLPEGVAMKVIKCMIEKIPIHLVPPESESSERGATSS